MKHFKLGEVQIHVQDEPHPNDDVFMIRTNSFREDMLSNGNLGAILANHVEDLERFVSFTEDDYVNIYTKQPDAAIEFALFLNREKGVTVSEYEVENVREQLIQILH